ncbi:MAG TPA: succinate dehydrogenase, hydrophobic membrane anchor protein [Hyphomicrobiaceae bacterium]|nr:succinate dehydrogenase, hydrophobic membrane anchor protein [Hyphomicrobiaceae bacterium]
MSTPLRRVRGLGSARDGTSHFWRQRLTAVANLILVPPLVVLIALLAGADHATVTRTLAHPLVALALFLLLLSAVLHMRIGMQVIIEDYVHAEGAKLVLLVLNTFFSIVIGAAIALAVLKLSFDS